MSATIIGALLDYFNDCPLTAGNRLNIDYLPENTKKTGIEYAISTEPTDEVVTLYRNGGAQCRYVFNFNSINDYGPDDANAINCAGFLENLAAWMRAQTRARSLPKLPEGLTAKGIRAIGSGFLYRAEADSGMYQIQCELLFYRKGVTA